MGKTQERGRWAEDLAARHLRGLGLKELHRNYLCRGGEIDIIMQEKATLVFIEVRYRRSSGLYGGARETLGATKKARLLRAASYYLWSRGGRVDAPCRFDVVTVEGEPHAPKIEWIKAAFDA